MRMINIEVLNPKAEKLLMSLVDLKLISISNKKNPFIEAVKKIRAKKSKLSLDEITKEVERVRKKRYGK